MKNCVMLYLCTVAAVLFGAADQTLVVQSYGAVTIDGKRIGSVVDVIRQNPKDEALHNRLFEALVARDQQFQKRAADAENAANLQRTNAAAAIAAAEKRVKDANDRADQAIKAAQLGADEKASKAAAAAKELIAGAQADAAAQAKAANDRAEKTIAAAKGDLEQGKKRFTEEAARREEAAEKGRRLRMDQITAAVQSGDKDRINEALKSDRQRRRDELEKQRAEVQKQLEEISKPAP